MRLGPSVANIAWLAGGLKSTRRFSNALRDSKETQARWLREQLGRHAPSVFGREHDFPSIQSAAEFAKRVPLRDYDAFEQYIRRIAKGEHDVLACGRVTHLAPTSGSTSAAKLIPFNTSVQRGFDAAVSPWIFDLARQRPALLAGPAYWSISPLANDYRFPTTDSRLTTADSRFPVPASRVPIGFADDADYLGGASAALVRRVLAVPPEIRHVRDVSAFWRLTLLALLRCRDLRLISVWHPSFIDLMVTEAEQEWTELIDAIGSGGCPWSSHLPPNARDAWRDPPDASRARELRRIGAHDWPRWWPRLQVISCWGEQAAEPGWRRLVRQLPRVLVQPKGLLATEAVVTIPWRGATPLAVTSHYFEFITERGDVVSAHTLERGRSYEVVVTNGGGFWRYRLGDIVECTGHMGTTPMLRFLGRAGRVSDLRGEKLSEVFVAAVLRELWNGPGPEYVALRARFDNHAAGYELLVSNDWDIGADSQLVSRAEEALASNRHYALARRLGQLEPLKLVPVDPSLPHDHLRATTIRLGDTKPDVLLRAI